MKSILLIGKKDEGKSTTAREVSKALQPTEVKKLIISHDDYKNSKCVNSTVDEIFNDTFIIKVKGKYILICAGAPTEQQIKITDLLNICDSLGFKIELALVSRRSEERKEGFDTLNELRRVSDLILEEPIIKIKEKDFMESKAWIDRIEKIKSIILKNL